MDEDPRLGVARSHQVHAWEMRHTWPMGLVPLKTVVTC